MVLFKSVSGFSSVLIVASFSSLPYVSIQVSHSNCFFILPEVVNRHLLLFIEKVFFFITSGLCD